ncbi:Drebrin-like protein [Aphelenchoides bicaudatus]|nr:Drebrin-like protein [Aphelenchoides bicaudatus]
MTCNFVNHERELLDAFDTVCNTSGHWTIFEYEANSNILKLGESGTGGLEELIQSFQDSRVQYGFVSISGADNKQQKIVLIHWQGASVPALKLANTASHIEEVRQFVKRVNTTIYARNQEDLDLADIQQKLQQLSTMAPPIPQKSSVFVPPAPVGSVYKPVREDLQLSERESFWKSVQAEEEERRREEVKRREEQQKQFQLERKILEKELNTAFLSSAVRKAQKEAENQPPPAVKPKPPAPAPTLVGGRTQMFNQINNELAKNTPKTPQTPKQYKFEIPISNTQATPINAGSNYADEDFIPIVEDPAKPIAKIIPQKPIETKQESVDETEKEPAYEEKIEEKSGELRAISLWDYQADDSSELSFDSNVIISDVKKTDANWWTGTVEGKTGIFPSNYVKIL